MKELLVKRAQDDGCDFLWYISLITNEQLNLLFRHQLTFLIQVCCIVYLQLFIKCIHCSTVISLFEIGQHYNILLAFVDCVRLQNIAKVSRHWQLRIQFSHKLLRIQLILSEFAFTKSNCVCVIWVCNVQNNAYGLRVESKNLIN